MPCRVKLSLPETGTKHIILWYCPNREDKVALCATVTCYRAKGAIRDVVKAHGLPEDVIKALSSDMCQMAEVGKGCHIPDDRGRNGTGERGGMAIRV